MCRDRPPGPVPDRQRARRRPARGDQASGVCPQQHRRILAADQHIGDLPHPGGRAYARHEHIVDAVRQRPVDQRHRHHAASGNGANGTGTGAGSIRAGAPGSGRSISSYMADRISAALRPGAELARARISAYRDGV